MPTPLEWDTASPKLPKQPPLVIGEIRGVLPYSGHRNPMSLSSVAKRISMTIATRATKGQPKLYHFESAAEMATALDCLRSPRLFGLEVQLPPFPYKLPSGRWQDHYIDEVITFDDGFRRAVFVRNEESLKKPKTREEIAAIREALPLEIADDMVVVNGNQYTKVWRDNLRRVWKALQRPDPDVDSYVLDRVNNSNFWLLRELIANCDLPKSEVYQSTLRLIGRDQIKANWRCVFDYTSRIRRVS